MKCLYCDKPINKESLYSLLVEEDRLCPKCRKAMKYHHQITMINGLRVETFYEYDSLFKDLLLQYKECGDEALKDVFIYGIRDYIRLKYHGYHIVYAPSTKRKIEQRGFDHLRGIFEGLKLKEAKGLRIKEELEQTGKNRKERMKMIDNYSYQGEAFKRFLIVDDVVTTGSTLMGIHRVLKDYGEVRAIVLASVKK